MASSFLEQKAKEQAESLEKQYGSSAYGGTTWLNEQLSGKKKKKKKDEDIAPVRDIKTTKIGRYTIGGGSDAETAKKDEERTWFTKGALEDGVTVGNIAKTILGTTKDIRESLYEGVIGIAESTVDAGAYVAGGVGGLFGADEFKDKTKEFIKRDLINEKKVAKFVDSVTGGVSSIILGGEDADEVSVLGEKSDSLLQSGGQLLATAGLQMVGVPWFVTTGLTSFGGEVEGAFNEGASYGEAGLSAAISAGAEILTEKISGGISFGGKTLDDALTKNIARNISNKAVRTLSKLGVDAVGEGAEEVLSGLMSAIGQKITYADDKELTELFSKEEAWESFIGGFVLGGGMGGINAVKSSVQGRDYASGLTDNEQKVIDKEFESRVAEQEQDGKKLSEKEKDKIYEAVIRAMEKGDISTDTIEEVLGGDTYKNYQNAVKNEDSLRETFNQLNQMKQGEMTGEQIDLRNELKEKLKELETTDERNQLKSRLSEEVFGLVQNDRLVESYNERGRRGQAFEADMTKYDEKQSAVVQKAIDSGILNNTRRTHEFVDMIAKIFAEKGVPFDFTNNQRLKESGFALDGKTVNGFVTKDGITLNMDSAKAWNTVVGHEITHVLEGTELYTELQTVLKSYAESKGEYQSRYDALAKLYEGVKDANIDAELTADLVGDYLFSDPDFINHLSTNNRNVFQKIYDEIKYLCKVATAGSKEARELEKVKRAFENAYKATKNTADISGVKYSLNSNAKAELHKALYDTNYRSEVLLRDVSPAIMLAQKGVKNLPMSMKSSHIRENVFTEDEAKKLGLKVDKHTHYHGLGEEFFLKVIDGLDNVNLAYRGTKNASDPARRENYFLLVSEFKYNGNTINVPVYIDEKAQYNRVFIDVNKISTVFGRDAFKDYINRQIQKGDLVRIKNRDIQTSERDTLIVSGYGEDVSTKDNVPQAEDSVKNQRSLSAEGEPVRRGYGAPLRDLRLETVSETESVQETAPVVNAENATTTIEHSVSDLADIAKQGRRENMRGAYTHNGKQYLSDGSFIAEFNTVDDSLEQSDDFPIKQAVKELDEAFARKVEGNYDLHTSDTRGFVKVGNSLFGTKRVNALIRALENPVFSLAKVHGGHEALVVTADNGRAVLMPVRASGNAYLVYEAQPIAEDMFPDDLAPMTDDAGRFESLTDADAPPETEAPFYGEETESELEAEDPFEDRDWYEVSNRKVNAYMYDHPEVKPFFQEEAAIMLDELQNTTKGEKWYNDHLYYESGGEEGFGGTKRYTSDSIARMLDEWKMSYADIEKGLRAIIEDHGAENIAAAKKVEFMLNERLLDGYKSFVGYEPTMDKFGRVPQNQDYINMLAESQIVDAYSMESFDALMAEADKYAPPISEEIAPVAMKRESNPTLTEKPKKEAYEAIRPKKEPQPRLVRADSADSEPSGKQRKWVKTSTESEAVDGKVLPEDLNQDKIIYQPIPNKVTLNKANTRLDSMGYESAVTYFNSQFANKSVSLEDVALGERLIQEAIKRGDNKTAGELIQNVSILGTELGQKVQALSIIKRLTPEGQLGMLQKTIERGKTKGDKAFEGVELTQEMIDKILSAYKSDGTYDQMVLNEMVEDVKQQIADKMQVTKMDKVNAWRYLSMLGNPKTHIRNLVSNIAMRGTMGVKNAVARTIESVAPISTRTKTWQSASQDVKDYAQRVTLEMKDVISGENRYSEGASIKEKRQIFKNKILNGVYEFNSDMLSKEDWWFSKPAFTNALSEFLTANGIRTAQDIKKNPELVEKARQYALEQSQIATFRQYSWLANQINQIERKNAATNIAVGSILPFKKTPINIAKTGLNYSPLGFMKTLTYDASQVKNGNMEASEMVDHLAQNITGSALALVGYMLAQSGFLNGAGDDDKEGDYDYQLGKQAYSVNIGDATFSLSWLSPVAMPLFVGANAFEQLVEGKEWNGDVVVETLAQTLDPLSEMSFISSLDSVLSSYDSGIQKFAGIGETMAQNYVTQFVPTLSSQIATVMDDTKRSTKVAADSNFKFVDQTINSLKYKIPLLRETLEPSTDIWGNEIKQTENIMARAVETFISPYARKDSIATAVDEEIKNLYAETGDTGLIPSIPYNSFSYDGEKQEMSAEDYTQFKKTYGQTAVDLMDDLFRTSTYQNADSETRADMVNKVYDYARDEARREYFAKYGVEFTNSTDDGVEVYKPNAIKGAIEHDMTPDEYSFYDEYPNKYKFFNDNGISYEDYKNADEDGKRAYTWAYENQGKFTMSKAISDDFFEYYGYRSEMNDFDAKDANGETVSGLKKERVTAYIEGLDLDYGQKIILHRSMYDSKEDKRKYNRDIVEYLDSREDISWDEMKAILVELDFEVSDDGTISW